MIKQTRILTSLKPFFFGMFLLVFFISTVNSNAQFYANKITNDIEVRGFEKIPNSTDYLIFGSDIMEQKPFLSLWNSETKEFQKLDIDFDEKALGIRKVLSVEDGLYLFGQYKENSVVVIKPFIAKVDFITKQLIYYKEIFIASTNKCYVDQVLFVENFIVAISESSGSTVTGNYFLEIDLLGNKLKEVSLISGSGFGLSYCSSLFKDFYSDNFLFTRFDTSETIFKLNKVDLVITELATLEYKNTASTGSPGYIFNEVVGGGYDASGNLFLACKYDSIHIKAPYVAHSTAIIGLDQNFKVTTYRHWGSKPDDLNKPLTYTTNDLGEKFVALIDNFVGYNQPNKSTYNSLTVSKVSASMQEMWTLNFLEKSALIPFKIIAKQDGGVLVCGSRSKIETTTFRDPFILEVDAQGLITAISFLKQHDFKVYPNPLVGTTVQVDLSLGQHTLSYQVLAQTGHLVAEGILNSAVKTIELPATMAPGTYFILFQDETGATSSKKMVKL